MRRPARGCSSRGGRERAAVGSDGGEREMAGGGEGEDAVAGGNGCGGWAGGGGEDGVDFGGCGDPPAATAVAEDERGIRAGRLAVSSRTKFSSSWRRAVGDNSGSSRGV
jgi:hypothetical protein